METIYIDRLFILNLIIDYLILLGTARVCGLMLRRWRYFFGALLGAAYAAASVIPRLVFLTLLPLKLAVGILMSVIAFGKEPRLMRCTLVFFAVSALFGGAVWAISVQSGANLRGLVYIPVSMPVLVLSFAVIYGALSIVFRRALKSAEKKVFDVRIEFMGKCVQLRALSDSGNTLYDHLTNCEVMICSAESLAPVFAERAELLKSSNAADIITAPEYSGRLRLIPYCAVGTDSGLLPAFRPDEITVDGKARDDLIVAISPTAICGDGFDCII